MSIFSFNYKHRNKVSEIRSPSLPHCNKTGVSLLSPKPLNALVLNQK